uniref:Uncharacterized protein n=1 Tax=Amphiprion percula TaxID=161767 RepID=A0A3P8RY04_AMPPE
MVSIFLEILYIMIDNCSDRALQVNETIFCVSQALFRVVISKDEARRVQLSHVPETVDALIDAIKEKLQLQGDFVLQFEDPEFQNALCNLSEISELPPGRAILHIKWTTVSQSGEYDSQSLGSISSLDTVSMNSSGNQTNSLSPLSRYWRSISEWPDPFPIPTLSLDVELKLRKGNESYESNKIGIDVSRDMKIEILDKIAQAAFDIKAYPDHDELESIALALIAKYPCLKEPGRGKGYEGWLVSIRNKLNNYRAKLREAGCSEVSVNKKRKADGDVTKYTLKRAKRGEVNHVPEHPEQHDDASLEEQRLLLVEASKKARLDHSFIREKMDLTFSLRRREIVEEQPMVMEIQTRWPALFFKEQVSVYYFVSLCIFLCVNVNLSFRILSNWSDVYIS